MKKRRVKLILISLVSIFTLINAGCTNKNVQTTPTIKNETDEQVTATEEILNADMFSNKIQLANNVLKLTSAKYEDFTDAEAMIIHDDSISENTIINSNSSIKYGMIVGNSKFKLSSENTSNDNTSIKDCQVQSICSESGNEVFFPKGVRIGDTFDDVTSKWGEPSYKEPNDLIYHYYKFPITKEIKDKIIEYKTQNNNNILPATHDEYIVNVDKATGTVKTIEYRWNNTENNSYKTFSLESISYKVPYSFTNNEFNNLHSVESIDNINYIIILPSNAFYTQKKSRDEATIRTDIPAEKFTDYSFEILKESDTELQACEFYKNSNNSLLGRFVYIYNDNHYISKWCQIISFNQDEILTDNAINIFKDKIKNLSLSVCKDK